MKRIICFALIVSVIIQLAACSVNIEGLNNFNIADCPFSLNSKLLPSETFLSDFAYTNGDYHYTDSDVRPKTFVFLQYGPEEYESAKEYCLNTFLLVEGNDCEFDGFYFIENHTYRSSKGEESWYPKWFNLFGYNDENHTLFFVGYYNESISQEEKLLATTDMGAFVVKHFGIYYDFT